MKRRFAVLALFAACAAWAQDGELDVYGYALERAGGAFLADGSVGLGSTFAARLKAAWAPSEVLSFHVEGQVVGSYGVDNDAALAASYGLGAPERADDHWTFDLDHAYGRVNAGPLDVVFGKQPIAWGTGYLYNPTSRTYTADALGMVTEETPGVLALAPSLSLGGCVSLQGYLAFQERTKRTLATLEEGDIDNLPWGLRVVGVLGPFDLSACFLVQTAYDDLRGVFRRRGYAGADFSGALGPVGLHAEAALALPWPEQESVEEPGLLVERDLEVAAGLEYTVPFVELETRAEYIYHGPGAATTAEYDVLAQLSGKIPVLGRHYLVLRVARSFSHHIEASIGSVTNLADGSWILLPALSWEAVADLKLEASALLPLGKEGSELDGRRDLTALGLGVVDFLLPSAGFELKLSF